MNRRDFLKVFTVAAGGALVPLPDVAKAEEKPGALYLRLICKEGDHFTFEIPEPKLTPYGVIMSPMLRFQLEPGRWRITFARFEFIIDGKPFLFGSVGPPRFGGDIQITPTNILTSGETVCLDSIKITLASGIHRKYGGGVLAEIFGVKP